MINEISQKVFDWCSVELSSREDFEKFLLQVLKEGELSRDEERLITGKIVDTVYKNPYWHTSLFYAVSIYKENSAVLLHAIAELASAGCVSLENLYHIVSQKVFIPLYDCGKILSDKMTKAIERCMLTFYEYTSLRERLAVYSRLWNGYVERKTVFHAVIDYMKLEPSKDKRELLAGILRMKFDEKIFEQFDRNSYLEFLSDAIISSFSWMWVYFYRPYWLYSRLFSLVEILSKKEFETLCERVRVKFFSSGKEYINQDWVRFLMFSLNVSDSVGISEPEVKVTESPRGLIKHMAPFVPYLSKERFWKLVDYIENSIHDQVCLAVLLNSEYINEDRNLMLKAFEVYLENEDEYFMVEKQRLLVDVSMLERLSLQQFVALAVRSVTNNVPVRFRFTPEAFELIRLKLIGAILVGEDLISRKELVSFISKAEVVQNAK